MNATIRLEATPRRIVSLVPSQTQLLHHLGLENEVVGITKFCIYPEEWFSTKDRVGGTKSVNLEKVRELQPDLIIGNKEENQREDIEVLRGIAPVWMSDIYSLPESLEMIASIAEITQTQEKATELIDSIQTEFENLDRIVKDLATYGKSVVYFIWNDPGMTAGSNTFIDDMLKICGLKNVMNESRYPIATGTENPDFVFLSSEPFPFKQDHVMKYKAIYPDSEIVLVDGELFSWYGSMLAKAPDYFTKLLQKISV